jgi:hypothetical protein
MAGETRRLAEFASGLAYGDIPEPVIAISRSYILR